MADSNEQQYMLTTTDNPYNPFTQWDDWLALDTQLGYYTPGLLARYTITSDTLSDADQADDISRAIDEIVQDNPLGVHRKVSESSYISEV